MMTRPSSINKMSYHEKQTHMNTILPTLSPRASFYGHYLESNVAVYSQL